VGVKLFVDDPLSDVAHKIFSQITIEPQSKIYVPELFFIEIANVLYKYVRWSGMSAQTAQESLQELERIALTPVPMSELMVDALALASDAEISAYDASYVALARRLDIPLITVDRKLATKLNQPERIVVLAG
jgi:predicted nucleic acid-binding protein